MNTNTNRALTTDIEALAPLNDVQRNATQQSFTQQILLIQGPPGTGKTQVAGSSLLPIALTCGTKCIARKINQTQLSNGI